MEVFFKNLTSEESPTERLVEDVMNLVEETEGLVEMTGANLPEGTKAEFKSTLEGLKSRCHQIKQQAVAGARSTDRLVRKYPYQTVAIALGVGILIGALVFRCKSEEE